MFNEIMRSAIETANKTIENDKNISFDNYDLTIKEARELMNMTGDRIEAIGNAFRLGFYLGRYQVNE